MFIQQRVPTITIYNGIKRIRILCEH